jgi:hypothetical protein
VQWSALSIGKDQLLGRDGIGLASLPQYQYTADPEAAKDARIPMELLRRFNRHLIILPPATERDYQTLRRRAG